MHLNIARQLACDPRLTAEIARRADIRNCEARLIDFVEAAWPTMESSAYQKSWAMDGLCDHLEAVTYGHIRKLLANCPPRCGKTTVLSIAYPAWVWARRQRSYWSGPGVKFLTGSYNHDLSLQNANKSRRLILSPWYQERWGQQVILRADQNTKTQFDTTAGGSRIATSVGGSLLGIGGDINLIDDPHNTQDVESEAERESAIRWWTEVSTTRLNDPKRSALICIMQRLHEQDVSGYILGSEDHDEWTHLMLPMRHDERRHCVTVLKRAPETGEPLQYWEDPREGKELLWADRYGEDEVAGLERKLGKYMASGRLQQEPTPSGGGIIQNEMWQPWTEAKYPDCSYILASLDTAYTAKEENDASALTVWGVFHPKEGSPKAILLYAWEGRLELHDLVTLVGMICSTDRRSAEEIDHALDLFNRGEVSASSLVRMPVDKLVIEKKASGISVAQELGRLYGQTGNFAVELVDPSKWGDKVARLVAVEPYPSGDGRLASVVWM